MTSLEIAELTGKNHFDLMRAIRKMEPAWEKDNGCKFALVEYQDKKGELRPCYQLTKTECLYIATKFNDEARAKLVLRWQELELAEQERRQQLCLPSPKKILALADEIIGEGLRLLNEPAEDTLTATQVAKTFNMTVFNFKYPVPSPRTLEPEQRSAGAMQAVLHPQCVESVVRLRSHR